MAAIPPISPTFTAPAIFFDDGLDSAGFEVSDVLFDGATVVET